MKIKEHLIKKYCQKYNYSYKIFNNSVIITTPMDEWKVDTKDDILLIYHKNKVGNKKGKCQYHFQRKAKSWDYVFAIVISRHESYSKVYNKAFRINKILKELHMA